MHIDALKVLFSGMGVDLDEYIDETGDVFIDGTLVSDNFELKGDNPFLHIGINQDGTIASMTFESYFHD